MSKKQITNANGKVLYARSRQEHDKDDKEDDEDTKNLNHQPSIGRDALKIFD